MAGIFISYRRQDSQHATGRIHDHFDMYFGPRSAYRDIDRIHAGADFPAEISKALEKCDVVVAVIGDTWLDASFVNGARRLDDPKDSI
jgi:hypothetical protein